MMGLCQFFRDLALVPEIWRGNVERARNVRRARKVREREATAVPATDAFYERYVLGFRRQRAQFRQDIAKLVHEAVGQISPSTESSAFAQTQASHPAATDASAEKPAHQGGAL